MFGCEETGPDATDCELIGCEGINCEDLGSMFSEGMVTSLGRVVRSVLGSVIPFSLDSMLSKRVPEVSAKLVCEEIDWDGLG